MVIKAKTQMLTDLPLNLSFFFPDNLKLPERYKYTHTHYSFLDQEQITDTVITLWLDWYEAYVNLENAFLSYFILFALNVFFFFSFYPMQLNWMCCFSFLFLFFLHSTRLSGPEWGVYTRNFSPFTIVNSNKLFFFKHFISSSLHDE